MVKGIRISGKTLKFVYGISGQFKSGGGDDIHTYGYEGSQYFSRVFVCLGKKQRPTKLERSVTINTELVVFIILP